jgi:hypothetical protein
MPTGRKRKALEPLQATRRAPIQWKQLPLHLPLDDKTHQIRLLTILPGNDKDPIQCQMDTHSLEEGLEFTALSYCWGDPTATTAITINGAVFNVNHNLGVALPYLRQHTTPMVFWIDAICIDQTNKNERNHQLRLMGRVYSSATTVLVWLGVETEESDTTMDLIAELANLPPRTDYKSSRSPIQRSLLARPWWSRVWIVQEVSLARTGPIIKCGRKSLPWDTFMHGCLNGGSDIVGKNEPAYLQKAAFYMHTLREIRRDVQSSSSKRITTLSQALTMTKDFEASDPRDKVYGCLGLLPESVSDKIQPDYYRPVDNVYIEAAMFILNSEGNLFGRFSFFSNALSRRSRPSWVPDFSIQETFSRLNPHLRMTTHAEVLFPFQRCFVKDNRLLAIQGLQFDILEESIELKDYPRLLAQIPNLELLARHATRRPFPAAHVLSDLKREVDIVELLVGGRRDDDEDIQAGYHYRAWEAGIIPFPSHILSQELVAAMRSQVLTASLSLETYTPGRHFSLTRLGFPCLSVAPARKGDVVAILEGECLPTLLRPRGMSYSVVGGMYVGGIMNNELAGLYGKGLLKKTAFLIR